MLPEASPADDGFGFALADSVKLAVQASWNVIKADADAIGRAMFGKLFERDPALLKNFGFRDVANYQDSRALKARCSKGGPVGRGHCGGCQEEERAFIRGVLG